jgi:hypothetical protein
LLAVVLVASACGGSPTNPTPPPTATRNISLEGNLDFGTIAVGSSAETTLRVSNSGKEALTVTGMTMPARWYSSSWTSGTIAAGSSQTATIRFTPGGAVSYNGTLTVNANHTGGTSTIPIFGSGQRDIPFRRSGSGDAEFWMPTDVERVRIIATYTGNSSNFIVDINNFDRILDERLGTAWNQTRYDATHWTYEGGFFSIRTASGVAWSFEEIR